MDNKLKKRKLVSFFMMSITTFCALFSVLMFFLVIGYISIKGISAINFNFITQLPKPVGEIGGGIANAIIGSVKIVSLAAVIGISIGVLGAIYLAEYGNNKIGSIIRYSADLLNSMPSIIIGIFTYTLVVVPMKQFSALAGSIALSIIFIPIVLRTSEEFIRLVPFNIKEGGLALGLHRYKVILHIILPAALRGIITGILLAISRIAGETAPLLFTAFGNRFWDNGLLNPISALPLVIFNYSISPFEEWHKQAWAAAFILILFVLSGNIIIRLLVQHTNKIN